VILLGKKLENGRNLAMKVERSRLRRQKGVRLYQAEVSKIYVNAGRGLIVIDKASSDEKGLTEIYCVAITLMTNEGTRDVGGKRWTELGRDKKLTVRNLHSF